MNRARAIAGVSAAIVVFTPLSLFAADSFCGGGATGPEQASPLTEAQCDRLSALRASAEHGLDPADYLLDELEVLAAHTLHANGQRFTDLLTQAYRRYAIDIAYGRLEPGLADSDWHIPRASDDGAEPGLTGFDPVATDNPQPPYPAYARLREATVRYLAIQADGGWPQLPEGENLAVGMRDKRVEIARNRLRMTGDFAGDTEADAWIFGHGLDAAVREFQARQGLKVDGVIGGDTRDAMNVPVEDRIRQFAIAMERWRWLPRDLGDEYAWVNAAELVLEVIRNGEPVLTSKTIVGHSSRPTPSLQGEIRQLVFNPTWSVPTTIANEDLLPKVRRDPEFLERGGYRVFTGWGAETREVDPATVDWPAQHPDRLRYRFVQDPGSNNSLGRVKIVFNNPHDIYLHDTPAKNLFTLRTRMFSSGCVRVERAYDFADYLLANHSNIPDATSEAILESPKTQAIDLQRRLPIYLVYITSWVTEDGRVHFRRDLYGRDEAVAAAMLEIKREADGLLTTR